MATRFDWAEQIAEKLIQQSLTSIANQIQTLHVGPEAGQARVPMVVFNPLTSTRTDLVTASAQLVGSLEEFSIVDASGKPTPHQVLKRQGAEFATLELGRDEVLGLAALVEMIAGLGLAVQEIHIGRVGETAHIDVTLIQQGQTDPALVANAQCQITALLAEDTVRTFRVRAHQANTVEFHFVAEQVPGCGFKTYFVVPRERQPGTGAEQDATRSVSSQPETAEVLTDQFRMENEFLAVEIHPEDGTLTVWDKATGTVFVGLHRFVDGGDRGDEYNYCPPEVDQVVAGPTSPPEVTWLERGPARWAVQIRQKYRLPASLNDQRTARSEQVLDVPITSQIELCRGTRRLDFDTEVENQARDHRLRVHFPTPVHTAFSEAESSFDVVRRPLRAAGDTVDWVEQPVPTHPQKAFVDVSDGRVGLLVANRGLPEYEVLQEPDGRSTVALTLLRCVGWLSRDDFPRRKGHAGPALETPEAQCLGRHKFQYALVPHAETWQSALQEAHAFNTPLRAVLTGEHPGTMPHVQSLLALQGEGLVLSAVKLAEEGDSIIVRFFNPTDQPRVARLRTWILPRSADLVNLAEEPTHPLVVDGAGWIVVETRGRQIVTLRLTF